MDVQMAMLGFAPQPTGPPGAAESGHFIFTRKGEKM
jgi:hypothetical protein